MDVTVVIRKISECLLRILALRDRSIETVHNSKNNMNVEYLFTWLLLVTNINRHIVLM